MVESVLKQKGADMLSGAGQREQNGIIGTKQLYVETAGLTHRGLVRTSNEDSLFFLDSSYPNAFGSKAFGIYLIADGMGGHEAGEVASETATRIISTNLLDKIKSGAVLQSPSHAVEQTIAYAHNEILKMARDKPELRSMGTTVTTGLRLGLDLYIGHVGDSRAYLIRREMIQQLTEDHSVVAHLVKEGYITLEEARTHPDSGKIFRCLGVSADIAIDTCIHKYGQDKLTLLVGDCLVFCSDGLTGYVSDNEILKCINNRDSPEKTCRRLIDLANSRGGGDNTSVIIVRLKA